MSNKGGGGMEESGSFLYDTLGSLVFSAGSDPDSTEYAVFRNHIISSADSLSEAAATDYLSLDFEDASEPDAAFDTPPPLSAPSRGADAGPASELVWFRAGSRFRSPMLQLHKEILDFCEFVSPTPEEEASRRAAAQCVTDIIKHVWPHCKVEVFGSVRTGLYLPTSDIDARPRSLFT